jgi:hypothetical protein
MWGAPVQTWWKHHNILRVNLNFKLAPICDSFSAPKIAAFLAEIALPAAADSTPADL